MSNNNINNTLQSISKSDDKNTQYEELLKKLVHTTSSDTTVYDITTVINYILNNESKTSLGSTYIPDLLIYFIRLLEDSDKCDIDLDNMINILTIIYNKLKNELTINNDDYNDTMFYVVDFLAQCYQGNSDFKSSSSLRNAYKLPDSSITITPVQRCKYYVDTAEDYLEVGDRASSAQYMLHARQYITNNDTKQLIEQDTSLLFRFKVLSARILDLERKFLEASKQYYELSTNQQAFDEQDKLTSLDLAVKCAILAKAGQQRHNMLSTLINDMRTQQLSSYELLNKMYKQQIIKKNEIAKFESTLSEHQSATTASGQTVLQLSMIEHNILAISKLYKNINFEQLSKLLEIDGIQTQEFVVTLIDTKRLNAVIDQTKNIIIFNTTLYDIIGNTQQSQQQNSKLQSNDAGDSNNSLKQHDIQIQQLCSTLDRVAHTMQLQTNQSTALT